MAGVNGVAAGVGCSTALAADLQVVTESASFLLPFARIGLMPDGGSSATVAASIGRARAMRMALLSEALSAREAFGAGLISHLAPDAEYAETLERVVSKLTRGAPLAQTATKRAVNAATLDRLDAPEGDAGTHGDVVRKEADALVGRVKGATGLMDTTLAAYKHAQQEWDPAWFNSVVIFTDGASDDTSSLSLDSLVNQLKTLRDPAKPVKVIIIGLSRESDTGELDEIATATGGHKYVVNNPNEILGILAQALLNR